jgi:hypothetical protein
MSKPHIKCCRSCKTKNGITHYKDSDFWFSNILRRFGRNAPN